MEPPSPSRVVRFEDECVLIPDIPAASKLPFVLTKSYSLPLWKKAPQKLASSDEDEDARVVIKVPIPLFRRRSSRSPGPHARSASVSPAVARPLPSCLHTPSSEAVPLRPVRRASLPPPPSISCVTVPLRPCCAACEAATDDALASGDEWKVHFTRGAKRRRSASLEQPLVSAPFSPVRPFAVLPDEPVEGVHIVRGGAAAATAFALRVDEVDQRRRSFSFSNEEEHYAALRRQAGSPPPPSPPAAPLGVTAVQVHPYGALLAPEGYRLRASPIAEEDSAPPSARGSTLSLASNGSNRSASGQSNQSFQSNRSNRSSTGSRRLSAQRRENKAILPVPGADDDADLFPLPRRSPSVSPRASPILGPPEGYFAGQSSPGASTSSLLPKVAETTRTSGQPGGAENSLLGPSLSRQGSPPRKLSAAAPATSPTSPTSPVRNPASPRGPRAPGAPLPTTPSPGSSTSSKSAPVPIPTPRHGADAHAHAHHFHLPALHLTMPTHAHTHSASTPASDTPAPASSSRSPSVPASSVVLPSPSTSPASPTSPKSKPRTPSPTAHRRVHSFAAPFMRAGGALRGAGADMLRGVGGLGGTGGVGMGA